MIGDKNKYLYKVKYLCTYYWCSLTQASLIVVRTSWAAFSIYKLVSSSEKIR